MHDIVDCQFHLFQTIEADQCLAVMDALGIEALLIDESWHQKALDTPRPNVDLGAAGIRPLALGGAIAARRHPDRFRYLLRVNHRDPEVQTVMRLAAADPYCAAFRIFCFPRDLDDLAAGGFAPVFAAAATLGRPVFVQTIGQSTALEPSFAAHPACRFVIDHVGLVRDAAGWAALRALAAYPNVALKWCHANLAFPSAAYPFAPMQRALREAVDSFGGERVLWASDATMLRPPLNWAEVLFHVRDCDMLTADERAWVLGGAARRLLGWPASRPAPRVNPLLPAAGRGMADTV